MGDAEGVASNATVKVPVWLAKAVFCHGPLVVVTAHTGVTELTVKLTLAECVRLPLVPVIVRVEVPAAAELLVVMVSVDVPEPLTEAGLRVAVTPAGAPLTPNATAPLKPLIALTVAV
jgi:hypothetical protein